MKKLLIIGIICCFGLHIIAQNDLSISNNERPFGNNLTTNKEIVGNEFIFPERIEKSYLETESNRITIQLRGLLLGGSYLKNNGHVVLYDLTNRKTIWDKSINYQNYYLEQNGKFIFKTGLKKTYCLDFENGEYLWKARNTIAFINPELKIGIGYTPYISNQLFYNNINFEGIDLNTGNSIWKREISHDYGLNDVFMLNDSVAMIVSSGLHSVNLKTGLGWDYDAVTGVPFMQAMKTEIKSNVIIDSLNIYFASKEKISRLDINGNLIWSTTLPEDLTSTSNIILSDNTLYMINSGSSQCGYATLKQGKPFLAAFNSENGKKLFLNTVDDNSGKTIESVIDKDELVVLYKDKIAKCSLKNGTLISEKTFDTGKNGEIVGFINYNIYNKFDSTYKSLTLTDTINHYIYTKKKTVLAIDKDLNVVNQYDIDQLYKFYLKYNKLRFLANKDNSIIIDKDNKIVAKIDIPGKAKKIGSKLYFVHEKSIIEIDLNEITQVETKNSAAAGSRLQGQ
jgi:outer membrane protein assembly factor BamB